MPNFWRNSRRPEPGAGVDIDLGASVTDREKASDTLQNGPYSQFPDSPAAYRENTDTTLEALFRGAVAHAQARIAWYERKAEERSRVAKAIRFWSLLFFAAGTLAPIAVTLLLKLAELLGRGQAPREQWIWFDYFFRLPLAEVGYVLLALAGALVIFDQFFDASGSWIRFRQAQARLEVLLAEFRFAWAIQMAEFTGVADRSILIKTIGLLRTFVTQVEMLAEDETKEWAQRFSQRINAYDRNPNLRVTLEREESNPSRGTQTRSTNPTPNGPINGSGARPVQDGGTEKREQ